MNKPKISIINTADLTPNQKDILQKTFDEINCKRLFNKKEQNSIVDDALKDAMKSDLFKDLPKDLQKILKNRLSENISDEARPNLTKVSHSVVEVLENYGLTQYEAFGVLEAVKQKLSFKLHCKKARD